MNQDKPFIATIFLDPQMRKDVELLTEQSNDLALDLGILMWIFTKRDFNGKYENWTTLPAAWFAKQSKLGFKRVLESTKRLVELGILQQMSLTGKRHSAMKYRYTHRDPNYEHAREIKIDDREKKIKEELDATPKPKVEHVDVVAISEERVDLKPKHKRILPTIQDKSPAINKEEYLEELKDGAPKDWSDHDRYNWSRCHPPLDMWLKWQEEAKVKKVVEASTVITETVTTPAGPMTDVLIWNGEYMEKRQYPFIEAIVMIKCKICNQYYHPTEGGWDSNNPWCFVDGLKHVLEVIDSNIPLTTRLMLAKYAKGFPVNGKLLTKEQAYKVVEIAESKYV